MEFFFLGSIFTLLLGIILFLISYQQRQRSGLPSGEILYADTGEWRRNERPLFSDRYKLTGKPDYLVKHGAEIVPVELKSTRLRGRKPFESHIMQLAAYCLLVEDVLGVRPRHGILKYVDETIVIDYTKELRNQLIETMQAMRSASRQHKVSRSHNDPARCHHCGYQKACEQTLS